MEILSLSEITKKDPTIRNMVFENGIAREFTIEDLQKFMSDIELIDEVPEKIKEIFETAKQLYIFGYFRHLFFTVAIHYASLALEVSLKNKFIQFSEENKIYLQKLKEELKSRFPSHKRDNPRYKLIESRSIEQLVEDGYVGLKKIIKEMDRLNLIQKEDIEPYSGGKGLRDCLSHPIRGLSFFGIDDTVLRRIAELINKLFRST